MTIERRGTVRFGDASITIMEDSGGMVLAPWQKQFKKDVFKRVVQQLNRLGWKCIVPPDMIEQYSLSFARDHRYCRKGDLQGFLDLSGRCLQFMMWQDVANVENPNGGRFESNKEERMPYRLWLEMERTRRRLRTYLCNVFSGYEFASKRNDGRSEKRGPGHLTALEWVDGANRSSGHYVPELGHAHISMDSNARSADGGTISHGDKVYAIGYDDRIVTGTAYYNLNNMWWVVTGKYDVLNVHSGAIYLESPGDLRRKRNERRRRKRLEQELTKAIKAMDFMRAHTLKQVLFPEPEQLFMVYHKEHGAYHGPNFSGYTVDPASAGKFTEAELGGYGKASHNKVIPVEAAA